MDTISLLCAQDNFHGRFNESDYEMSSFWARDFKASLFGSAETDSVS